MLKSANLDWSSTSEAISLKIQEKLDNLDIETLAARLVRRANVSPESKAFDFVHDDSRSVLTATKSGLNYRQLHVAASFVAELLEKSRVARGDRVLLVFPAGLDFIAAFYACLYLGVTAVPVPAVKMNRGFERWKAVFDDADVSAVLTVPAMHDKLKEALLDTCDIIQVVNIEEQPIILQAEKNHVSRSYYNALDLKADEVALIQYTSGSTGLPKGVVISQANIVANLEQVADRFEPCEGERSVSWLPHYHDMGLVSSIMSPVYSGFEMTLMSPAAFLRNPMSWLILASDVKAAGIGGPNFAYEYCAQKADDEIVKNLDLSHLKLAFNGAEMLKSSTLSLFAEKFEVSGFKPEVFFPCFGMAEATVFATGASVGGLYKARNVNRQNVSQIGFNVGDLNNSSEMLELVGCGHAVKGLEVIIVDPEAQQQLTDNRIGEVWLSGPNIAQGYWRNEVATNSTFRAIADSDTDKYYFRTGDLGFLDRGELFITGRLKDLIVIRGVNYYSHDIQNIAELCHPDLLIGGSAAFGIEIDGEERLAMVLEVDRKAVKKLNNPVESEQLLDQIRLTISQEFNIQLAAIAFIKPGRLPKTSSGKVQHHICREFMLSQQIDAIYQWQFEGQEVNLQTNDWMTLLGRLNPQDRLDRIIELLQTEVAACLSLGANQLPNPELSFFDLGLDSVMLVSLKERLEQQTGELYPATLVFEYPTIFTLSKHLSKLLFKDQAVNIDKSKVILDSSYDINSQIKGNNKNIDDELDALCNLLD